MHCTGFSCFVRHDHLPKKGGRQAGSAASYRIISAELPPFFRGRPVCQASHGSPEAAPFAAHGADRFGGWAHPGQTRHCSFNSLVWLMVPGGVTQPPDAKHEPSFPRSVRLLAMADTARVVAMYGRSLRPRRLAYEAARSYWSKSLAPGGHGGTEARRGVPTPINS